MLENKLCKWSTVCDMILIDEFVNLWMSYVIPLSIDYPVIRIFGWVIFTHYYYYQYCTIYFPKKIKWT